MRTKTSIVKAAQKELERDLGKRNLTKNEQMLAKVMLGEELTETERERWDRLNYITDLRILGYPKRKIAKLVQERYEFEYIDQAYPLIKEATAAFGERQERLNREAESELLAEMMMELYAAAKQKGDLGLAKDCLTERGRLLGLYREEKLTTPPVMPVIVLSTNEADANKEQTIDISHEDHEE